MNNRRSGDRSAGQGRAISVVIPVKNDCSKLERCLEALQRQTIAPSEVVIVDNNSTDITPLVASWWNTTYLVESGRGIPAAASAGYDQAAGDIIARLDADSVPSADWIEHIATRFDADPSLDALTGPGQFSSLPPLLRRLVDTLYMDAYFAIFGPLGGHPPVFGSNFAMRRHVWSAARTLVHRTDPEVHDDLDLSLCLSRQARVVVDRDLRVSVSARPFADPRAFAKRVRRGVHTVRVNRGLNNRDVNR